MSKNIYKKLKSDITEENISLVTFPFSNEGVKELKMTSFGVNWPIVYLILNKNEMYVGETNSAFRRLNSHLSNSERKTLNDFNVIYDEHANKSVVLDVESLLIRYLSAEKGYYLQNKNDGQIDHNYYDRERREEKLSIIWSKLKEKKIVTQDLMQLKNSDLFKYSPYTALTEDQMEIAESIYSKIIQGDVSNFVINGGAGTGKTILALYLIKMLKEKKETAHMRIALVVSMTSLRKTLKKVLGRIRTLKNVEVIGPSDVARSDYDILVVDESHRLKTRRNNPAMGAFDNVNRKLDLDIHEGTQLHWILKKSKFQIFFYDSDQSVYPADIKQEVFEELFQGALHYKLNTQLRVEGGNEYMSFIKNIFDGNTNLNHDFKNYDFRVFNNLEEIVDIIKEKETEFGICRMLAGYAWKWESKNDSSKFDIEIDNVKLRWNSTTDNWVYSNNAINEVGCIHTVQGYDLNYAGVIIGPELSYDFINSKFIIKKSLYKDINGYKSVKSDDELLNYILNIYKVLLSRAIKGTYLYVCDENLRQYFKNVLAGEVVKGINEGEGTSNETDFVLSPFTPRYISIPIVGCAPCGNPLLGDENIEEYLEVEEVKIKKGFNYFILRAQGDSMDLAGIMDGDLVLCRQQFKADTGDRVVALLGDNVTIKMYDKKDGRRILVPKSKNSKHKIIYPEEGDSVQGIVQEVITRLHV